MSAFYLQDQWPAVEKVGKVQLTTDEDANRVAGCIFWHPHSGQTQDQIQLVCQEAAVNKIKINIHFLCVVHWKKH